MPGGFGDGRETWEAEARFAGVTVRIKSEKPW